MMRAMAPADLFFSVAVLGLSIALGLTLCLWWAEAPLLFDAVPDGGEKAGRHFGEIV